MAYFSEGLKSGVLSADVLLADTGECTTANTVDPSFWIASSVNAVVELQHRNSENNSTLFSQRFWVGATQPFSAEAVHFGLPIAVGERVRLMLVASLIGSVQGTVFCQDVF